MMRTACVAVLACLTLGTSAAAQEDGSIFPFETRRLDLDNGLRAYLIEVPSPGMVAYVSAVRTGSRDEVEEGRSGYAHFFEHMMFKGTEKYPDYDLVTSAIGAARNAFTSNDMTVYYLIAAAEHLPRIADLESDRFRNLRYPEEEFRTEAGAILGEYGNSATSPFSVLDREIRRTAWREHTYRHQTIGFEEDIRAMPEGYEYSLAFHDRYYRPDNIVLLIAGDFDVDAAEELVRRHYADWEAGYVPPEIPVEPEQTEMRTRVVEYEGRTLPVLSLNWKAPAWDPDDRIAVATELLGDVAFGENSEVYRRLVLRERRVQRLRAGFGLSRDPGLVSLTATVSDPDDVEAVREVLMEAVESARTELADPAYVADAKSHARYSFLMGLETPQSVAFSLVQPVVYAGEVEAVDRYYRTLATLTPEDLREAARRVLVDSGLTRVTLVQEEGS